MSKQGDIILRIQCSEGTRRVSVNPDDPLTSLFDKAHEVFQLQSYAFSLYRERNQRNEIVSSRSRFVKEIGLKHGDLLYLSAHDGAALFHNGRPSASGSSSSLSSPTGGDPLLDLPSTSAAVYTDSTPTNAQNVTEHHVDQMLSTMDGKIQRPRDEKFCHHGRNACCVHCSPMEPFDEAYLKEQNIKHMSFHSYLRKLRAGVDKGKFVALENISCRIKPGCKEHPPWPKGICSKCQPTAISLNRQIYRHVDNVMFENPEIVERFLDYWRATGHQRMGFLYGKYEVHQDVPLGIRATVAAIYEPPQRSTRDKIELMPDDGEAVVDDIARQLGLTRVGWIFTDLITDDVQRGTVKHLRNIDTFFLSAQECIMAGHFQNQYPNPCKLSSTGYFGSKFSTVCVTGDDKNQVHMVGYAVSSQCMSLVRDGCLVPTKDCPQLGYIRESTDKQYVPDVYYKEKDTYGNEISKLARPLPVEYLLVDVPASTPLTPLYTFRSDPHKNHFPIENRMIDRHLQDFNALSNYLHQFSPDQFLQAASDFHFLLYIATMDMLPLRERMGPLLTAVREKDSQAALEWSQTEDWATLEQLVASSTESPSSSSTNAGGEWTCPHCTFLNLPHLTSCDMCSLPR